MTKIFNIITLTAISLTLPFVAHAHNKAEKKLERKLERKLEITHYKDQITTFKTDGITVMNPFARQAKKGQNSAAFVKITNLSDTLRKIVKASSPVANIVELHTSTEENGVHKMRPVKDIEIPAQGSVNLKSGGFHVMLIGLKDDLVVGQYIPVTLDLDNGVSIETTYKIKGCCGSCH